MEESKVKFSSLDLESKSPLYWLSCFDKLLDYGFTLEEMERVVKQLKIKVEDLTDKEDFENGCHNQKAQLFRDWFVSEHIEVYEDIKVDGQYISMKGYKKGEVQTFIIPAKYQGLKHGEFIKKLLENKFKWFKKFVFDFYSFEYNNEYEFYLKTEFGSLYIPLKSVLERDYSLIIKRMKGYYKDYRLISSYELNKNKGEGLEDFKERKEKEYLKDIKPLESKEAKQFERYLTKPL